MSITLNGLAVNYKPGYILNEKLSDSLDTGMLIIPQTAAIDVEPMDQVVITETAFTKYMLVSDIKRTTSRFQSPKKYNYTLNLVSPTIQLQRIVLPNRKITQPLTGSKFDIMSKITQYMKIYAPSTFTISSALKTLVTGVTCPELQWNRPTLFEVFNDLLSEVDAVVTMTDFTTISYLDLNKQGSEISDDDLSEVEEEQNIQEYASKIEAEVENAFQDSTNTRVVEWLTPKTDSDAILTTENAKLILDKPIEKITKVLVRWCDILASFDIYEADITDYVVEKSVYDLLDSSISTGYMVGDFKRSHLYYERETNIIDGLCYHEDTWVAGINSKKALLNVFRNAYYDATSTDIGSKLANSDIPTFVFKVEYQAIDTVKLITNKTNSVGNESVLINNQDTSYVDFMAFANKQQSVVDRIGQPKMIITGKYASYDDIPSLADYYETDYKLSEREFAVYDSYVNFKGTLNKNYVLKELYSGLKSQRRFTSIASSREAIESNHITEYDLIFQKTNNSDAPTLESHMLKFGQADENIKLILLRFYSFNGNFNSVPIGLTPTSYFTNRSVLLNFKFLDNYNAGMQSIYNSVLFNTNISLKTVPYTDSKGNYDLLVARFYKKYTIPVLNQSSITLGGDWRDDGLYYSRKLPELDISLIDSADYVHGYTAYRYKDNREITAETFQYNFLTDTGIFLGYYFFKDNPLTYTGSSDITFYVAYSTTETYSKGDQVAKGTIAAAANLTYTITDNRIVINSPDSSINLTTLASWAICDVSGNLYIGNNGTNDTIYLNKYQPTSDGNIESAFFENEFELTATPRFLLRLARPEFDNTFTLTATMFLFEIFAQYSAYFENDFAFIFAHAVGTYEWENSDVTYYNSASNKVTAYVDSTGTPRPSALDYPELTALRLYAYNMQASSLGEYNIAGTKLDISSPTIIVSTGEDVEDILEAANPTAFNTFKSGNMTNTVLRVTDANLSVTYWKPTYPLHGYYKNIFVEI